MIQKDMKQCDADIKHEKWNAQEASISIEENKAIENQQAKNNKETLLKCKED